MSLSLPSRSAGHPTLLIQGALVLTAISIAGQITLSGGLTTALSQAWRVPDGMPGLCSTSLYLALDWPMCREDS